MQKSQPKTIRNMCRTPFTKLSRVGRRVWISFGERDEFRVVLTCGRRVGIRDRIRL